LGGEGGGPTGIRSTVECSWQRHRRCSVRLSQSIKYYNNVIKI